MIVFRHRSGSRAVRRTPSSATPRVACRDDLGVSPKSGFRYWSSAGHSCGARRVEPALNAPRTDDVVEHVRADVGNRVCGADPFGVPGQLRVDDPCQCVTGAVAALLGHRVLLAATLRSPGDGTLPGAAVLAMAGPLRCGASRATGRRVRGVRRSARRGRSARSRARPHGGPASTLRGRGSPHSATGSDGGSRRCRCRCRRCIR
jgi:hypothetical protein